MDFPSDRRGVDSTGIGYQAIFEQYAQHSDRGLLLVDGRRHVLTINRAARELLGYDGTLPRSISDVVRDLSCSVAVGDAIHDRRPVWHELYLPDPDRLLRFHIVPILATDGRPMLVLASIEDITRIRHLETVRRDFVANVSHELRTPIASINLLVETLQNGAMSDPDAARHFLQRIEVETQSMARLVEELLQLSRLESGALTLELEPVALHDTLEEVLDRLSPMARDKQLDIRLDVQSNLPPVSADRDRIEQVLVNLVHNAIKFTPVGGEVIVRARRQGLGVEIEVSDTGVGMDPSDAARVFERFYKVDKGRSRDEGAGLGLAIARHLLELHGSRLQAVSEVGQGSRFTFTLALTPS